MTQKINVKGTGAVFNGEMPGSGQSTRAGVWPLVPGIVFVPVPHRAGSTALALREKGRCPRLQTPQFSAGALASILCFSNPAVPPTTMF